jgi:hypothetical protein
VKYKFSLAILLLFCSISSNAAASQTCTVESLSSSALDLKQGDRRILIAPNPEDQPVGTLFSIGIHTCDENSVVTKVKAVMPVHGHGMNYRPKISQLAEKSYQAEGLLFHMPGIWLLTVVTKSKGTTTKFQSELLIKP